MTKTVRNNKTPDEAKMEIKLRHWFAVTAVIEKSKKMHVKTLRALQREINNDIYNLAKK